MFTNVQVRQAVDFRDLSGIGVNYDASEIGVRSENPDSTLNGKHSIGGLGACAPLQCPLGIYDHWVSAHPLAQVQGGRLLSSG